MKKKTTKKHEYLNDFDAWQHALARVNLSEAVTPIVRGKTVEDTDTYNKVQQLLDCPDMEHAHEFLLDVDFDELNPETVQKVDDLYQLAAQQGFITGSTVGNEETEETAEDNEDSIDDEAEEVEVTGTVENDPAQLEKSYVGDGFTSPKVSGCAYTLFYSAMKDGKIRTGESYSNATTAENAKADVIKKLQKLGFTAIDILACEECDPDLRGTASTQPQEFGNPDFGGGSDETLTEAEEKKADNDKSEEKEPKEEEEPEEEPEEEEPEEEPDDEKKEMSRADKIETFKKYLNEFKALLKQMKAESYADMALADRAKFYADMTQRWKGNPDPTEFMSDDNVKQIETMRIKLD